MEIRIVNKSCNPLPSYETIHSAGMDLRASLTDAVVIGPMKRALIPTGIFMEIPEGYEAQIRPRSGLALKYGITVLNSPGTIDSDYRGEVKVVLINLGEEKFEVKNGDRIAQIIISKHEKINWKMAEELNETTRGEGGYGSTGK